MNFYIGDRVGLIPLYPFGDSEIHRVPSDLICCDGGESITRQAADQHFQVKTLKA